MKKTLLWFVTLIITFIIIDIIIGLFFDLKTKNGNLPKDYKSIDIVLRHNDSDILVLGSSVALNGINTKKIEDSLHVKTFNGGGNGQFFPFYLTMLKGAVQCHVPDKVILCMIPQYLTDKGLGNRYNLLNPYFGMEIADIDENLKNNGKLEKILLKSNAYRLNSIWFRILLYGIFDNEDQNLHGFVSKPLPLSFPVKTDVNIRGVSSERKKNFEDFLQICKENDIDTYIIFAPQFSNIKYSEDNNALNFIKTLKNKYAFNFWDLSDLQPFSNDSTLFYDNIHLNYRGAEIFTDTIISRLK